MEVGIITEAQHQTALFKWAIQPTIRAKWPCLKLLFHVPNGGTRDPIEAKHLKQQGVKAGVPDLQLPVPRGGYHGLWLEMKTESGTTSPAQDWWIAELSEQGYFATKCHGWESAVRVLEWYLSLEGSERKEKSNV